jgi:hypothetical protein
LEVDFNAGWLTVSEIHAALHHMEMDTRCLSRSVMLVIRAMECAEAWFGKDRVRWVFHVSD